MISFTYTLTTPGGSEAVIADEANRTTLCVSYLSDALRDFIDSLIMLLEGRHAAECCWLAEPGEYHWHFTSRHGELFIRLVGFKNWEVDRPVSERGKMLFKAHCPLHEFATTVFDQLTTIYSTLGPKEYKRRWVRHEFPLAEYRKLSDLLGQRHA